MHPQFAIASLDGCVKARLLHDQTPWRVLDQRQGSNYSAAYCRSTEVKKWPRFSINVSIDASLHMWAVHHSKLDLSLRIKAL